VALTGRNALPELIQVADIVTGTVEVKQYYNDGIRITKEILESKWRDDGVCSRFILQYMLQ
jgi:hypothetical protein